MEIKSGKKIEYSTREGFLKAVGLNGKAVIKFCDEVTALLEEVLASKQPLTAPVVLEVFQTVNKRYLVNDTFFNAVVFNLTEYWRYFNYIDGKLPTFKEVNNDQRNIKRSG